MRFKGWFLASWIGASLAASGCHSTPQRDIFTTTGAPPASTRQVDLGGEESARLCVTTADQLQRAGKLREATLLLEKARQQSPRLDVSHRLGILYDLQGEFIKGQSEFQQALKSKPKDANLLNDMGYSYYCQGMWEEAESHLRKAVAIQPKNGRAWTNLGLVLAQQGQYDASFDAFTKAVSPAQAKCNIAFVMTAQGRREDAKNLYREALASEPGLAGARLALAKLEAAPRSDSAIQGPRPTRATPTATPTMTPASHSVASGPALPRMEPAPVVFTKSATSAAPRVTTTASPTTPMPLPAGPVVREAGSPSTSTPGTVRVFSSGPRTAPGEGPDEGTFGYILE